MQCGSFQPSPTKFHSAIATLGYTDQLIIPIPETPIGYIRNASILILVTL